MLRRRFIILLLACCLPAAGAVELHIQFGALERMLAESIFTQEGRKYVKNDRSNKCNFAYLEKPQVRGEGGKLRIRARFTGRSALNMFGQCVGLGDAFNVAIVAMPQYRDGNLALGDIKVESEDKTGYYIRRVCAAISGTLGHDFRYPIAHEFQRTLEDPAIQPSYPRSLREFRVSEVRVGAEELVLVVEFELTVK